MIANTVEVLTLFVDDIGAAKTFYARVFAPRIIYEDEVSAVLEFGTLMINLLQHTQAPELVAPLPVAPSSAGPRVLLTIKVGNVDQVCADLASLGLSPLNGPIDRPWGRRTAAFADPSGHVWEVAQEI
ncbi:VOC family protein [Devosia naphthalenivorans]|uniref:VOC family protein n=1 Tax=Devosia naphthalenivorans TaxID=2082392 RepID=UPI000D35C901|nr:VOC family protein [Devosia naphthalenivorans]